MWEMVGHAIGAAVGYGLGALTFKLCTLKEAPPEEDAEEELPEEKRKDEGPFRTSAALGEGGGGTVVKVSLPPPKAQEKLHPFVRITHACPKCGSMCLWPKLCAGCPRNDTQEHLHMKCDCGNNFLSKTQG